MKLEKFDLEKALNGAKVVTRDGREVTQLTNFKVDEDYPLCGVVDSHRFFWTIHGCYRVYNNCKEKNDLFLAVETQSIWVNVYKNNDGSLWIDEYYNSRKEAKENINGYQYIKTVEITDETENQPFNTKEK